MSIYRSLSQNGHREDLPHKFDWSVITVFVLSFTFAGFMVVGAWDLATRFVDFLSHL